MSEHECPHCPCIKTFTQEEKQALYDYRQKREAEIVHGLRFGSPFDFGNSVSVCCFCKEKFCWTSFEEIDKIADMYRKPV